MCGPAEHSLRRRVALAVERLTVEEAEAVGAGDGRRRRRLGLHRAQVPELRHRLCHTRCTGSAVHLVEGARCVTVWECTMCATLASALRTSPLVTTAICSSSTCAAHPVHRSPQCVHRKGRWTEHGAGSALHVCVRGLDVRARTQPGGGGGVAQVDDGLVHTWCMDSAVHRGEGARCVSALCVAQTMAESSAGVRSSALRWGEDSSSNSCACGARKEPRVARLLRRMPIVEAAAWRSHRWRSDQTCAKPHTHTHTRRTEVSSALAAR